MPAPVSATYTVAALVGAHTGMLDTIDGAATAGKVLIKDDSDVLLATITLNDPCGSVSGVTGILTITEPTQVQAVASGTATYGELLDGDDNLLLSLPATSGVVPVAGYIVLNTTAIKINQVVALVSATIG